LSVKPSIETLSPGYDDPIRWNSVEVYGFSLLSVIPNEHTVWYRPDQRLTRKMIPAPDAESRGNTSPGRSVQIIKLGTTLQAE
jgi:hypothetical protein